MYQYSIIEGENAGDRLGEFQLTIANLGDINGDGFEDLAICSQIAKKVYVIFGSKEGIPPGFNLSNINGTNGFVIDDLRYHNWGEYSIAKAGDVNNDGIGDFIIAQPNYGGLPYATNKVFIVYGKTSFSSPYKLDNLQSGEGFIFSGNSGVYEDDVGTTVAGGLDINNDGVSDILIASWRSYNHYPYSGQSYVIFGGNSIPFQIDRNYPKNENGILVNPSLNGYSYNYHISSGVEVIKDINGDGINDMVFIPSSGASVEGLGVYILYGSGSNNLLSVALPSDINGDNGFIISTPNEFTDVTFRVKSGDFNGDGKNDLLISKGPRVPWRTPDDNGKEAVYILYGKNSNFPTQMSFDELDVKFIGESGGDYFGGCIQSIPDVNNDGFDEILITDSNANNNNGAVYFIYGSKNFVSPFYVSTLNGTNGFIINGSNEEQLGHFCETFDANGDGKYDLVIGAPCADPNGKADAGAVYVFDIPVPDDPDSTKILITSGGTYTGTPGNDEFIIDTSEYVTIISDTGQDIIKIYPATTGNIDVPDFDCKNDQLVYLTRDGECPPIEIV